MSHISRSAPQNYGNFDSSASFHAKLVLLLGLDHKNDCSVFGKFAFLMSTQKTSLPRGTRDFGPQEMARRQYILDVLKKNFLLYGFPPIETPAMENLSTLTGKYVDNGPQFIY